MLSSKGVRHGIPIVKETHLHNCLFYWYNDLIFFSFHFSQDAGPCSPNPCENNGTCFQGASNLVYCNCTSEFEGERCESGKQLSLSVIELFTQVAEVMFFSEEKGKS